MINWVGWSVLPSAMAEMQQVRLKAVLGLQLALFASGTDRAASPAADATTDLKTDCEVGADSGDQRSPRNASSCGCYCRLSRCTR